MDERVKGGAYLPCLSVTFGAFIDGILLCLQICKLAQFAREKYVSGGKVNLM